VFCGERIEVPRRDLNNEDRAATYDREEALAAVANLERGDLVYFGTPATDEKPMRITHVGIYLGNNRMIHSSHRVRINSLIPGDEDYYENSHRLVAATRL
jgi:cell wall-associated NlpC family hydrolase